MVLEDESQWNQFCFSSQNKRKPAKNCTDDQSNGVASTQETAKNARTLQLGKEMTDVEPDSKLRMT